MNEPEPPAEESLLAYVRATRVGRHRAVAGRELGPRLALLRAWQSNRLAATYADLLAHPRFAPACRFFLSDVYAARDFSQRDHDVERMYASTQRLLPPPMLRALRMTIELNTLTAALDDGLAAILFDELGVAGSITADQYAEAYRRSGAYADRRRQIDLLVSLGRELDGLIRMPAVGVALRLARVPARLAGWRELQDFFERGFAAFKAMGTAREFLAVVERRESLILDRIVAGAPDPFALGGVEAGPRLPVG